MQEAVLQKNPSGFLHGWGETGGREASKDTVIERSLRL